MRNHAIVQAVMKVKGVYDGEIDGLWGLLSQDAIRMWATDTSFDPALPTRGQPFAVGQALPKGLAWRTLNGEAQIVYTLIPAAEVSKVNELLSKFKPLTMEQVEVHCGIRPAPAPAPVAQSKQPPLPTKVEKVPVPDAKDSSVSE